ncbi:hypothetical protein GCM10017687_87860 [Streptomyces echinatus]
MLGLAVAGLKDAAGVRGERFLAAASAVGVLGVEDTEDVRVLVVAAVGAGLDGAGAALGGGQRVAVGVVAEDEVDGDLGAVDTALPSSGSVTFTLKRYGVAEAEQPAVLRGVPG